MDPQVPPGTNGGVSRLGTLSSMIGGLVVSVVALASIYLQCGYELVSRGEEWWFAVRVLASGTLSGLLGSFVSIFHESPTRVGLSDRCNTASIIL